MNFLAHIGAICALRTFHLDGRRVEIVRADALTTPPTQPGAGWDVKWNAVYRDSRTERSTTLSRFIERNPTPVLPATFESYLAQVNALLMLRDLPPVSARVQTGSVHLLRVRYFDTNSVVTLAAKAASDHNGDAAETWERVLEVTGSTKRSLFADAIAHLSLSPDLSRVIEQFAPDHAAAPLPLTQTTRR